MYLVKIEAFVRLVARTWLVFKEHSVQENVFMNGKERVRYVTNNKLVDKTLKNWLDRYVKDSGNFTIDEIEELTELAIEAGRQAEKEEHKDPETNELRGIEIGRQAEKEEQGKMDYVVKDRKHFFRAGQQALIKEVENFYAGVVHGEKVNSKPFMDAWFDFKKKAGDK